MPISPRGSAQMSSYATSPAAKANYNYNFEHYDQTRTPLPSVYQDRIGSSDSTAAPDSVCDARSSVEEAEEEHIYVRLQDISAELLNNPLDIRASGATSPLSDTTTSSSAPKLSFAAQRTAAKKAEIDRSISLPISTAARIRQSMSAFLSPKHTEATTPAIAAPEATPRPVSNEPAVATAFQGNTSPSMPQQTKKNHKPSVNLRATRGVLRSSSSNDADDWNQFLAQITDKHPELKESAQVPVSGEFIDN